MLEKIVSVQNVGRFTKLTCAGEATFRRITLIFGRNGDGKSTITSVLRAGAASLRLTERYRLGATSTPEIKLLHNGAPLSKKNGTWQGAPLPALIFDREFIDKNVHLGGEVSAEQRQNLLQLALGDIEVSAAQEVEELAKKVGEANARRAQLVKQIEPLALSFGLQAEVFLSLPALADAPADLIRVDQTLANAKQAQPISERSPLASLPLPSAPNWSALAHVLSISVESISEEIRQQVAGHFHRLGGEHTAQWVHQGVILQAGASDCPYCGQDLTSSALAASFTKYFSDAYEKHVSRLQNALSSAEDKARTWDQAVPIYNTNEKSRDFWSGVLNEAPPAFDVESVGASWRHEMDFARASILQKLANPVISISVTDKISNAADATASCIERIQRYNEAVATYNQKIATIKRTVAGASLVQLEQQRKGILAAVARHNENNMRIAEDIGKVDREKKELEKRKIDARKKLDLAKSARLEGFEKEVNKILAKLGVTYRVTAFKSVLPGGRPAVEYAIQLDGGSVSASARVGGSAPTFRTVLSEGDKSSLALAVFVASARLSGKLNDSTLVFDDPMTSLDEDRTHSTQELLEELANAATQVVVLSHQPRFLLNIGRGREASEVRSLRIDSVDEKLVLCDLRAECISDYERRMTELLSCAQGRRSVPETELRASIRIVLEEYLRCRFPHRWTDSTWLGKFATDAQADTALQTQLDVQELTQLAHFSSPEHHGHSSTRYVSATPNEIKAYAERTYRFIAGELPRK